MARHFREQIAQARAQGLPVILVQWDGGLFADTPDTFSRDWVLFPDIRAEEGDLLVRAGTTDPFVSELPAETADPAHTAPTADRTLADHLKAQGWTHLEVLALPETPELAATLAAAQQHGLDLRVPEQTAAVPDTAQQTA